MSVEDEQKKEYDEAVEEHMYWKFLSVYDKCENLVFVDFFLHFIMCFCLGHCFAFLVSRFVLGISFGFGGFYLLLGLEENKFVCSL